MSSSQISPSQQIASVQSSPSAKQGVSVVVVVVIVVDSVVDVVIAVVDVVEVVAEEVVEIFVIVVGKVVVVTVDKGVVTVVVDECLISSSPDRHCVTMCSSLTRPPPPVLTSQPFQSDRGHRTYLSCSLTRRPL